MTKKVCYIPYLGDTLNNKPFEQKESWEAVLKKKLNSQGVEINTMDKQPIKDSTDVVFFDNYYYRNMGNIIELYDRNLLHKTIYIDYEPPTGHCKTHSDKGIKQLSKIFKCVITYNDDLIDNKRIFKGCIANFYSKPLEYKYDFNSRKLIVLLSNKTNRSSIINGLNNINCTTYFNKKNIRKHKKQIYEHREKAAMFFTKNHPEDFDLYGSNWGEEFSKTLKGPVERQNKYKVLSQYKFAISYDSYHNQNGYISEKIFDLFIAKTIPIYWGASNISKYIPKECYIDKRDFKNYYHLVKYLKNMSEEEYNNRILAIENYLNSKMYLKNFSSEASANVILKCLDLNVKDYSYIEAKKNLNKLRRKQIKVESKAKLNFCASYVQNESNKKIVEITFAYSDFTKVGQKKFVVKVNGKIIEPFDVTKDRVANVGVINHTFSVNFEQRRKRTKVIVYLEIENRKKCKKVYLNDLSREFNNHEVGKLNSNHQCYRIVVKKKKKKKQKKNIKEHIIYRGLAKIYRLVKKTFRIKTSKK